MCWRLQPAIAIMRRMTGDPYAAFLRWNNQAGGELMRPNWSQWAVNIKIWAYTGKNGQAYTLRYTSKHRKLVIIIYTVQPQPSRPPV